MKARVLADFLVGRVDACRLADELATVYGRESGSRRPVLIEPMEERLVVSKAAMLRVCDAVLAGELDPALLEPIGDCLMFSDSFEFGPPDDDVVATVAHYWGTPEICYPLDIPHVRAFRTWLESGTDPLR